LHEARPGLPVAVSTLVARLLQKSVAERPADGDEVAGQLKQLAATMGPAV
jgi:hypothetical protein